MGVAVVAEAEEAAFAHLVLDHPRHVEEPLAVGQPLGTTPLVADALLLERAPDAVVERLALLRLGLGPRLGAMSLMTKFFEKVPHGQLFLTGQKRLLHTPLRR